MTGKRIFDLALVGASAPIWGAFLLMGAAAVVLDSGRPVFFSQRRMGRERQPFRIFKLRTMRPDVEAPSDALYSGWTYSGDPRVTKLGRILRKYRVDELPQVWNILWGDMSWVGPRPEPWDIAAALGREIPGYHRRHRMTPGLTGPCQISERYVDFGTIEKSRAKFEVDLEYDRPWSLRRDLSILASTLGVVFGGQGLA